MRVLLNGRELPGLDSGLERRLAGGVRNRPIDSLALSPAGSIVARAGQLRLLLGAVGAGVVLLMAANLAIIAARVPSAMGYAALAAGIGIAFTGALVWVIYALMLAAHRRRVEARPDTGMSEGVAVGVGADELTVDGRLTPWTTLRVDELWVRERLADRRRITYPERLTLDNGGRAIVLDALLQSGGQTLLEQAWRRLKLAGSV